MSDGRKQELIRRLEAERAGIARGMAGIRHEGNLARKVRRSIRGATPLWVAGAAVAGWLLSRIPARRKTVYVEPGGSAILKKSAKSLMALGLLKVGASLLKPAATAFATRKLADLAGAAIKFRHRRADH